MNNLEEYINGILEISRANLVSNLKVQGVMSSVQFFGSFRYLSLNLPRGAGKTYVLNKIAKSTSSLYLSKYTREGFGYLEDIERCFRGIKSRGLKYKYILIDEELPSGIGNLYELIDTLNNFALLDKEYLVLHLGTAGRIQV